MNQRKRTALSHIFHSNWLNHIRVGFMFWNKFEWIKNRFNAIGMCIQRYAAFAMFIQLALSDAAVLMWQQLSAYFTYCSKLPSDTLMSGEGLVRILFARIMYSMTVSIMFGREMLFFLKFIRFAIFLPPSHEPPTVVAVWLKNKCAKVLIAMWNHRWRLILLSRHNERRADEITLCLHHKIDRIWSELFSLAEVCWHKRVRSTLCGHVLAPLQTDSLRIWKLQHVRAPDARELISIEMIQ